jgi:hypothetical protein
MLQLSKLVGLSVSTTFNKLMNISLSSNIRLGRKVTNTLAYCNKELITTAKSFLVKRRSLSASDTQGSQVLWATLKMF